MRVYTAAHSKYLVSLTNKSEWKIISSLASLQLLYQPWYQNPTNAVIDRDMYIFIDIILLNFTAFAMKLV